MLIKTLLNGDISIMPRTYKPIDCSKSDIIELQQLSAETGDQRMAVRARIVLMCIAGRPIKDIAAELDERPNTVIYWRDRFKENGIPGLGNLPRGKHASRYGKDLKNRIFLLLKEPPPDGAVRWTGISLSKELGVPPDVIWRYLRKANIRLADATPMAAENRAELSAEPIVYDIPLRLSIRKENNMSNNKRNENHTSGENMDLEIIARIKGKDGTIIERKIQMDGVLPNLDDFDLCTLDGFRRDFDQLEKNIIAARSQVSEELEKEYLAAASKKNSSQKKP